MHRSSTAMKSIQSSDKQRSLEIFLNHSPTLENTNILKYFFFFVVVFSYQNWQWIQQFNFSGTLTQIRRFFFCSFLFTLSLIFNHHYYYYCSSFIVFYCYEQFVNDLRLQYLVTMSSTISKYLNFKIKVTQCIHFLEINEKIKQNNLN